MVLLQTKQICAGDPQQQAILGFDATIGQWRKDSFPTSLKFENVHIKATLQPAVPECLSDQGGRAWDGHFCEVPGQ